MKKTGDTYDYTVGNKRFSYTIWEDLDGKLYIRRNGEKKEIVKKYGEGFNSYVIKGSAIDVFDSLPEIAQEHLIFYARRAINYCKMDNDLMSRKTEGKIMGYLKCLADMGYSYDDMSSDLLDVAWERAEYEVD